jgi:hypothetical protein
MMLEQGTAESAGAPPLSLPRPVDDNFMKSLDAGVIHYNYSRNFERMRGLIHESTSVQRFVPMYREFRAQHHG